MFSRRIFKNTLLILLSGIFSKIIWVLFIMYAARRLGPETFGIYGLILAGIFLFSFFQNLGLVPLGIRLIAQNKSEAEKVFNQILSLRILLAGFSYFMLLLSVCLLYDDSEIRELMMVAGLSLICFAFSGTFRMLYVAFEKMSMPSLVDAVVSILSAVAGITVLYLGYGLTGLVWISVIGNFAGVILSCLWIRNRFIHFRLAGNFKVWHGMIRQALPFAIIGFSRLLDKHIGLVLLSKLGQPLSPGIAVGYFNAAASIPSNLMLIPQSIRTALLPPIAANIHDTASVGSMVRSNVKLLFLLVCLPLLLSTALFSENIVVLLFGPDFRQAAPALTIMGMAYAVLIGIAPLTVALSASDDIRRFVPWSVLASIFSIACALLLIPFFSFKGAAMAVLFSAIFRFLVNSYFWHHIFQVRLYDWKQVALVAIAVLSAIGFLFFLRLLGMSPILLASLTITMYSTAACLWGRQLLIAQPALPLSK